MKLKRSSIGRAPTEHWLGVARGDSDRFDAGDDRDLVYTTSPSGLAWILVQTRLRRSLPSLPGSYQSPPPRHALARRGKRIVPVLGVNPQPAAVHLDLDGA